jgi:hypothetical protein
MMPVRRRTRAGDRAARINWERGSNAAHLAAGVARHSKQLAADNDPPPF